jgi:putative hemolysin
LIILVIIFFCFYGSDKFKTFSVPGLSILDSASKNCTDNGGTIQIKQRGDGKEYKVCFFEDNRQCEADSLLNGDCPVGGLKVTGYITGAATYCAILGGKYEITGMDNNAENGNCSFFNGNVCNVWDLYNGKCEKGASNAITYENEEFNFSLKIPGDWKDKYQVKREDGENGIRYIFFDYSDANLFKIAVVPYSFWEKQETKEGEYIGRNNADVFAFVYSSDPLRSDKQWGEEYLKMVSRAGDIKNTFKITKPYIFLEKQTENGKNYTIETMYPYVGAIENGQVNIEISNFVDNIVTFFKEMVGKADAWDGDNSLKIFYEPYEINSEFVSIRFEVSEYTGGAHPNTYSKSFNYDFKNNKIINLSDIFDVNKDYLNNLSNKTIQYLLKTNNESGLSDEETIRAGAGPKEENFKTFTFSKNTIVFYFNPNQVAVYVAGRQDVIFPLSPLKDILRSDAVSNYQLND